MIVPEATPPLAINSIDEATAYEDFRVAARDLALVERKFRAAQEHFRACLAKLGSVIAPPT